MFDIKKSIEVSDYVLDQLALMSVQKEINNLSNDPLKLSLDLFEKFLEYRLLFEITKSDKFYKKKTVEEIFNIFLQSNLQ